MIDAKRIGELRRRLEAMVNLKYIRGLVFDKGECSDLLALLEKAAQIKAGEDKAVKLTGELTIAPVADTSPGLSAEDERILRILDDTILGHPHTAKEKDLALCHVRSRLAEGSPEPAPPSGIAHEQMPAMLAMIQMGESVEEKCDILEKMLRNHGVRLTPPATTETDQMALRSFIANRPHSYEDEPTEKSAPPGPGQKRSKELMIFLGALTFRKRLDGSWTDEEFDCYQDIIKLVISSQGLLDNSRPGKPAPPAVSQRKLLHDTITAGFSPAPPAVDPEEDDNPTNHDGEAEFYKNPPPPHLGILSAPPAVKVDQGEEERGEMVDALTWAIETLIEKNLANFDACRRLGKIKTLILAPPIRVTRAITQELIHAWSIQWQKKSAEAIEGYLTGALRALGHEIEKGVIFEDGERSVRKA